MIPPQELNSSDLSLEAVKQNGKFLRYVSDDLKTFEICLAAVKQNEKAVGWVPEELRGKIHQQLLIDKLKGKSLEQLLTDDDPLVREVVLLLMKLIKDNPLP